MKQSKKTTRILAAVLCGLMLAVGFTACKAPVDIENNSALSGATQDFPVAINEVTIKAKPSKAAVLSPSVADVILAMGYETSLSLASDDCTQPELQDLPKISASDTAGIIAAGVDLVLAEDLSEEQKTAFTQAEIPAVSVAASSDRADFERLYTQVGSVLLGAGTGSAGGMDAAQKIFTTLDDLSRVVPESDKIVTACLLLDTTSSAVTGDQLYSTVLSYAGITNILQGSKGGTYDFQQLKLQDPDFIFCPEGLKAEIVRDPNFSKLTAVTKDQVYEVTPAYLGWEGRSVISAATYFAGIAHPELLEESSASVTLPDVIEESSKTETSQEESSKAAKEESSKAANTPSKANVESSSVSSKAGASSSEPEKTYTAITPGEDGDEVLNMQDRLHELGFLTEAYSGMYGEVTEDAVKAFQKANSLKETGKADSKTLAALYSKDAKKAS